MSSFSASIRLYTDQMSPEEITDLLGVAPSEIHRIGEGRLLGRSTWTSNVWGWEAERVGSLEDQLKALLKEFRTRKETILSLRNQVEVYFRCACFSPDPEITVTLSPETMSEMGSFGGELEYSVYAVADGEDS